MAMALINTFLRELMKRPLVKSQRLARIAISQNYWYHYFQEYYKKYRIDSFPNLGSTMYGIYVGIADPETIPKSPPDPNFDNNDWDFVNGIAPARAIIDSWVEKPIYVQHYPDVGWATHVDPGWEIYQQGGTMLYYALNGNGDMVGTYWAPDELQGLLNWLDESQVPTGVIGTYQGVPITFYLQKSNLDHVYEATVCGHTKRFDNWRLQDCRDFIAEELTAPKDTTLTLTIPDKILPRIPFTVTGTLTRVVCTNNYADKTNQPFSGQTIELTYDGTSAGSAMTDSDGNYTASIKIDKLGTFTLTASYAGNNQYNASQATATVQTGPSRQPIRDLLNKWRQA